MRRYSIRARIQLRESRPRAVGSRVPAAVARGAPAPSSLGNPAPARRARPGSEGAADFGNSELNVSLTLCDGDINIKYGLNM